MRQIDIVGMSLAELSLTLIFVVLALVGGAHHLPDASKQLEQLDAKLSSAQRQINDLESERHRLQERIQALTTSRPNLRSVALPSCAETKVRNDWLFTAMITGADRYDISGSGIVTLDQILNQYRADIEEGKNHGCIQRIQVLVGDKVSAKDYDLALRHLEQYFYPKMLGSAR